MSTTLNSIAIDVVGQYSEAAKHLVNAYRVGSERAINGLGGRYEHLLESRKLPLITEELKSAFIVSQQRLSGLVLDAITRTTDRAEEAVDQLSSRAVNGMEAFGAKTAWASDMFVVNAARTINLPVAKLSLGIANRVNQASGRLSARSYPHYEKFRSFFRQVLLRFAAIGMQTGEDAERIIKLGADESRVSVVGSLKSSAAKPQSPRFTQLPRYGKMLLVAGSTHAGEEQTLLSTFAALRPKFPELTMVLAPRHPQRFDEVEDLLRRSGFGYCRRSRTADDRLFAQDILLLDTLGELGEFYACGDIAFVGGSLVDVGGHNILEPARAGKVILFGPYMSNVKAVAEEFKAKGAAIEVADGHALCTALAKLLADEDKRIAMGQQALTVSVNGDVAVENNYALAARYLSDSRGATVQVS